MVILKLITIYIWIEPHSSPIIPAKVTSSRQYSRVDRDSNLEISQSEFEFRLCYCDFRQVT